MKTNLPRIVTLGLLACLVGAPAAYAQRSLGTKKGPVSKMYLAETTGDTQIQNGDKIYTARQATAFDAPGTVIQTKAGATNSIVYSNGTGMFVDENTRVEVDRFVQEPFQPERDKQRLDTPEEPSISKSNIHVAQGAVGICTSQLVSGSSMNYSTPLGNVNIRGGRVSIESTDAGSFIDLLEGDITVRGTDSRDLGGQILRPGERATITPSFTGGPPTISVGPIPPEALQKSDDRTNTACNAKKSVTFDVIEQKALEGLDGFDETAAKDAAKEENPAEETAATTNEAAGAGGDSTQVIVARPTVPSVPPANIVISPDRLPST